MLVITSVAEMANDLRSFKEELEVRARLQREEDGTHKKERAIASRSRLETIRGLRVQILRDRVNLPAS